MKMQSLEDLYVHELRDLWDAENRILDALPRMAQTTSNKELQHAFEEHLEHTRHQKERLSRIFGKLNKKPDGITCKGIQGIINEGEEILKSSSDRAIMDAVLIGAVQRVEHYEMAGYGTARSLAWQLGFEDQAAMLQETLNEEGETDHKLTAIAEQKVHTRV